MPVVADGRAAPVGVLAIDFVIGVDVEKTLQLMNLQQSPYPDYCSSRY